MSYKSNSLNEPLTTIPSSAETARHVTSDLWPVNIALGVTFSQPGSQKKNCKAQLKYDLH